MVLFVECVAFRLWIDGMLRGGCVASLHFGTFVLLRYRGDIGASMTDVKLAEPESRVYNILELVLW